ncbi:MAG: alpha/beta fold hydrolase [Caulobacteraceae bacterium]
MAALFQYFPSNYVWNLTIAIALESGARIGEIEEMSRPLLDAAARGEDAGTAQFMAQWVKMADKLVGLADEDLALGRGFSAADKLNRASLYYQLAERMQGLGAPGREETYAKALASFQRSIEAGSRNYRRVEIPYEGGAIAGYLTLAEGVSGPAPLVLYVNGLDSTKEMLVWSGLPEALAKRGVSTLSIDQPGTGEALRLHNLPAIYDTERWASVAVDWLEQQPEVDAKRLGMGGISLGGYYGPRAVANEPRFACGFVWGANHNWGEVQEARLKREGELPVPHYWNHVRWVWGAKDMESFQALWPKITLDGQMEKIRVPFLITHGEKDRQIPLKYAHQSYDQLTNSPKRELKLFTDREGGVEHVGADNMSFGRDYIADWLAETLGGRTA